MLRRRFPMIELALAGSLCAPALGGEPPESPLGVSPSLLFVRAQDSDADPASPETELPEVLDEQAPQDTPAEGSAHSDSDLAKKLQNPVADLISVPFQFNWNNAGTSDGRDALVVNMQPVVPITLSEDWNLISRTIIPLIYAERTPDGHMEFGLGDTLQSLFFSPREPINGWVLGAGPAILLPTGTKDLFRSKQLGLGPTGVALRQDPVGENTLTYGALANHVWKVAGSDELPTVNSTFFQPFVALTTPKGTTFVLTSESTYNWTADQWTIPVNLNISQVTSIGGQRVQFQIGGRYYAEAPRDGQEWGVRFEITLLFPK